MIGEGNMGNCREISAQYQIANALAAQSLQKDKKQILPVCPASVNALVDDRMVSHWEDLGELVIPVNLIVGVARTSDQVNHYTSEFLPIPAPNSKFAEHWMRIYEVFYLHEVNSNVIKCYEYLGKFYVADGLKRVSVAKFLSVSTMRAQVVRILPIRKDTREAQQYFDFLFQYRLTHLYQLQFTQPGFFEQLQSALGNGPSYRWSEGDRSRFLMHWNTIEEAFRKAYGGLLRLTTADALVVLMRKYSYEQILQMESWVLARIFQALWKELYALSFPNLAVVGLRQAVPYPQTA